MRTSSKKINFISWLFSFLLSAFFIIFFRYYPHDPDSQFYIFLVEQVFAKDWTQWIAPQWMGHQGIPPGNYVMDHFSGNIIQGALLSLLGIPPSASLLILHLIQILGSFFLFYKIIERSENRQTALLFLFVVSFTPIMMKYRITANHEAAVLFSFALCIYAALSGTLQHKKYVLPFSSQFFLHFSFVYCVLVKGFIVLLMFPVLLLVFFYKNKQAEVGLQKNVICSILATIPAFFSVVFFVGLYCYLFFLVTGKNFINSYYEIQFHNRTVAVASQVPAYISKLWNLAYYIGAVVWYAFPWSIWSIYLGIKNRSQVISFFNDKLLLKLFVLFSLSYLGIVSLSNRIAPRYIFVVYYFVILIVSLFLGHFSPKIQKISLKLNSFPYAHPVLALLFLFLNILTVIFTNNS